MHILAMFDTPRRWYWLAGVPLVLGSSVAHAGPPFFTNDPDPPAIGEWEIVLPSTLARGPSGGTTGELTTVDFNYGFDRLTQLSVEFPVTYRRSASGEFSAGSGDVLLEYKRRFGTNSEAGYFGINPAVSLPTGDADRGLGRGNTVVQLPLLYQRRWGEWIGYADVRYKWHGSEGKTGFWFLGSVVERRLTDRAEVGVELYGVTAQAPEVDGTLGFNIGVRYTLAPRIRLIASAGRAYGGVPATTVLAGLKLYF